MKDIENKLAAFLMEYGVLKNADADRMARKIAGMFEKEGELGDLKEVLKAEQEHRLAVESVRDALQSERDQLAAKCAEMRGVLSDAMIPWSMGKVWKIEMATLTHALSSDCGKGWLSPEKAERLRKALEVCITALGSSLSDKRWEVRRIAKQALDETK